MKLTTLLTLTAASAAEVWDYKFFGADWPNIDPEKLPVNHCGGKNQSPIDLKWEGWPKIDSDYDKFQKIYSNQEKDIKITWNGHTSIVRIDKVG